MLLNFIKTALRFLRRNLSFTVINIIGLTTGISAFLLIALFLQHEMAYDKHLPEEVKVYRMVGIQEPAGVDIQHVAISSGGWAPYLNEHVPEVVEAFRLMRAGFSLDVDGEIFREATYYSEGGVLCYFGLPAISDTGNEHLLDMPNQAVVSKEAAMRMFGSPDVIGHTFRHNNTPYTITAVYDNEDVLTHLRFNVLLSLSTVEAGMEWLHYLQNNSVITYLTLLPGTNPEYVEQAINTHYEYERQQDTRGTFMKNTFYLQEARDIYLRSGHIDIHMVSAVGNINSVYVFTLVAVLVLVIACINFINLSTANSINRAREVGMRKVLGASRGKLALQFIGESMVLTFISVLLALMVLELVVPEFNSLLGTRLQVDILRNPLLNVGLLFVLFAVGLVAGFYPGMVMSRFQPTRVLKPGSVSGKPQAAWLRIVLVVFQFAVSTSLILATVLVLHQIHQMQRKDLGYEPENVIYLSFDEGIGYDRLNGFKSELGAIPEIQSVALASQYNGVAGKQSDMVVHDPENIRLMTRYGYVDPDFFPTMGIELIRGRNFSHDAAMDPYQAAIINESAWRSLGLEEPLGARIANTYHSGYDYFTIVGVIRDYNYYPVRLPITPALYLYQQDRLSTMNIRYNADDPQAIREKIQEAFHGYFPGLPFRSNFITDVLANQTRNETNTMKIFLWSSVLCVIISCLGLFGLTSYMMNQRKKEISIRKVLGASVARINLMLMTGFIRLVLVAVAIAFPVTYYVMEHWLDNYPYRIHTGVIHFAVALLIILGIAASTVLFYSTKASRRNPVDHLKYE